MEDLYKILPLTLETVFMLGQKTINCQFDTLADLHMADKILTLVFQAEIGKQASGKEEAGKQADDASSKKENWMKQLL